MSNFNILSKMLESRNTLEHLRNSWNVFKNRTSFNVCSDCFMVCLKKCVNCLQKSLRIVENSKKLSIIRKTSIVFDNPRTSTKMCENVPQIVEKLRKSTKFLHNRRLLAVFIVLCFVLTAHRDKCHQQA